MSLWRWTRNSSFRHLALLFVLALPISAAADVSTGPVSPEEAAVLWKDGKSDFDHGLYEDAIPKLERLIARYPGYPGFSEAHWLLGRAYLKLDQPAKAKGLLKDFVQSQGKSPDAVSARLDLGRADLALKQYSEALLLAEEILKLSPQPEPQARALVLKSRALIGLRHDARASQAIHSAEKAMPPQAPASLQGETRAVRFELKLHECGRFPSAGPLGEEQVRDQLRRRGSCLLEGLLIFRDVLGAADSSSAESAEEDLKTAYTAYWNSCKHPPAPPPTRPKDRNARQRETYFREMAVVLEQDCRQKIKQGTDLLKEWTPSAPAATSDSAKAAETALESLARERTE